jgi:hypothetical protein
LAQAIDYASDVAEWSADRISDECSKYLSKPFEDVFNDRFPDIELENININSKQRIVLVGFSVESSLERMIQWLSDGYNVNINAVVLNYLKTAGGVELLAKTSIITDELEQERMKKRKKFEIPMSDEPGTYDDQELRQLLTQYLSRQNRSSQIILKALLPACLELENVTRDHLKANTLALSQLPKNLGLATT